MSDEPMPGPLARVAPRPATTPAQAEPCNPEIWSDAGRVHLRFAQHTLIMTPDAARAIANLLRENADAASPAASPEPAPEVL